MAALGNFLAGELVTALAAGVAVVVALVPSVVKGSWRRTVPWPLLVVVVLPFLLSATRLPLLADFVRSVAVATFALLVVVVLQMTTTVRMTPAFAVWFSTIATLGVAGIWAFCAWVVSLVFDTAYFETNTELMLFFSATFVAGLVTAGVFTWYFRRRLRENARQRLQGDPA